jgi:hypothetical protein
MLMAPTGDALASWRECRDCGLLQVLPPIPDGETASCARCGALLHRAAAASMTFARVNLLVSALLFLLALNLPFFELRVLGRVRPRRCSRGPGCSRSAVFPPWASRSSSASSSHRPSSSRSSSLCSSACSRAVQPGGSRGCSVASKRYRPGRWSRSFSSERLSPIRDCARSRPSTSARRPWPWRRSCSRWPRRMRRSIVRRFGATRGKSGIRARRLDPGRFFPFRGFRRVRGPRAAPRLSRMRTGRECARRRPMPSVRIHDGDASPRPSRNASREPPSRPVRPLDRPRRARRPALPSSILRIAEEGSEARTRVEARDAQPIDRTVLRHERDTLTVGDQGVVFDSRSHGESSAAVVGRIVAGRRPGEAVPVGGRTLSQLPSDWLAVGATQWRLTNSPPEHLQANRSVAIPRIGPARSASALALPARGSLIHSRVVPSAVH